MVLEGAQQGPLSSFQTPTFQTPSPMFFLTRGICIMHSGILLSTVDFLRGNYPGVSWPAAKDGCCQWDSSSTFLRWNLEMLPRKTSPAALYPQNPPVQFLGLINKYMRCLCICPITQQQSLKVMKHFCNNSVIWWLWARISSAGCSVLLIPNGVWCDWNVGGGAARWPQLSLLFPWQNQKCCEVMNMTQPVRVSVSCPPNQR